MTQGVIIFIDSSQYDTKEYFVYISPDETAHEETVL